LSEDDIHPEFIASARCVCAMGTHLSHPLVERQHRHNRCRTGSARRFTSNAGLQTWPDGCRGLRPAVVAS